MHVRPGVDQEHSAQLVFGLIAFQALLPVFQILYQVTSSPGEPELEEHLKCGGLNDSVVDARGSPAQQATAAALSAKSE
jgi:hypothetical protein